MSIDLALVGATGLVGELFVLASENSEGKSLRVGKKSLQVRKA
jgi:aspartate-semialdehyde dehydrogenase